MRAESLFKMSGSGVAKESLSLREMLLASALATDRISWTKLQRDKQKQRAYTKIQDSKIFNGKNFQNLRTARNKFIKVKAGFYLENVVRGANAHTP